MDLVLVRHGAAEEYMQGETKSDADRRLTETGIRKTKRIAKFLASQRFSQGLLVNSSLCRAVESADILATRFPNWERTELNQISPYGSPALLAEWILEQKYECIILVGHEPQLSALTSLLLTGKTNPIVTFKKSGAAALHLEHGVWKLKFFVSPKTI